MSEVELPDGWALTSIDQVATHYSGNSKLIKGKLSEEPGQGMYPAFSASGQDVWHSEFGEEGPAIIVSAVGARCGKAFRASGKWSAIANTHIVKINPIGGDLDYFYYLLNREHYWVRGGSAQPFVRTKATFERPFPLPPLAEQKRIVAKIEELFSELDAGEESLRRARRQLGVYRQSLLKQAFEGKLTADWRAQHPDLLESPEAPWREVEVSEVLTSKPTNGRSVKDRTGGFKVLRLTALKGGRIDLREYKEGDWDAAEAANHVVRKGDFLLSRGNGSIKLVGRGGVVLENADIAFPDTMIRLPLDLRLVDPSFFGYLWNSEQVRRQIESSARTTAGIYKINQSLLTCYRLPLCSLPEQQEIVRLLDEQFEVIEQNEREIDAALKRSEALRQSILKKAFTGQLVAQDPADEPASALLERIRAERQIAAIAPKVKLTRQRTKAS